MDIEISVSGDRQLNRRILRVGDRAQDASPAFSQIVDQLIDIERDQFATKGQHGSGGWAPYRSGPHEGEPASLVDTDALRKSLTRRGDEHQRLEITPDLMIFGTDLDYAAFHQHGTSRMAQRRPLELTEGDRRSIVRQLQSWLITGQLLPAGSTVDQIAGQLE